MLKVVQIKGSNGSGKTSIVKDLLELRGNVEYLTDQKGKCYATVMHDVGWIGVGKYTTEKAMGGCDGLPTVDSMKLAISTAIQYASLMDFCFGIVFEGMMISTIKSTFYNYLLELEKSHDIEPVFVILETTPSGCVRRMEARRGKKRANLKFCERLVPKCAQVIAHAATYDQQYVRWFDVEDTEREDMLLTFLELVGDEELLYEWGSE